MPEDIEAKMDAMTPEELTDYVSNLKDGGENYQEPEEEPPIQDDDDDKTATEEPDSDKKEPGWDEEPGPPVEGSEQPEGDDDFLSISLESVPEEQRESLKKAQEDYKKAVERVKEKERGADEKFRKAAEMRKEAETPPQPVTPPPPPKEPWFKKHNLSEEDAKVITDGAREAVREEFLPQIYPFLKDQVDTKEKLERLDLIEECNKKGLPPYEKYEDAVNQLVKEVPGLTKAEAYRDLAFDDAVDAARGSAESTRKAKADQEQQRVKTRERTHHFEDSRPRGALDGKPKLPENLDRPGVIEKHMDDLKIYDPSGKAVEDFMGSLEEDTSRR